ncbi:hypothetical protein BX666DRAFT_1912445 [Dichotomocladium elegans]|nr:hypothetical protein BX666DRAFT_1912445 [Dichotomocladium elegans]
MPRFLLLGSHLLSRARVSSLDFVPFCRYLSLPFITRAFFSIFKNHRSARSFLVSLVDGLGLLPRQGLISR